MLLDLFLCFVQVGLFSIGGGYAAMPMIQAKAVEHYHWLTMGEFTDLMTIAEMTPGPITVNSATFVGIRMAGIPGALVATMGCILPSLIIVSLLSWLYEKYRSMDAMQAVLACLRPAVVALIASAVANDGEMIKPRYVDNIVSADGQAVKTFYKESLGTVMSESEANTLTELMKGVVQSGTAVSLSDLPYNIAGKTGTAEHGSDGETPHSWFVGFSNADDPDIVIAVVAENGGYSSEVAVPIARQVIEAYYAQQ